MDVITGAFSWPIMARDHNRLGFYGGFLPANDAAAYQNIANVSITPESETRKEFFGPIQHGFYWDLRTNVHLYKRIFIA